MHSGIVVTLVLGWALVSCSSSGSGGTPGGSGGQAGAAGAGGGGSGGQGGAMTGPAITTAPPNWAPPQDCSGVGDVCPNGIFDCTGNSVCQVEGYVCVPKGSDTMLVLQPRTAERPYCLAFQCMTYEEASCFCTGKAGKQFPTCSSPAAVAGLCKGSGSSCVTDKCCDGLTCIKQSNTVSTCEKTCTATSDCDTGCCTDPHETGQTICAPLSACQNPCKKRGDSCTANVDTCCTGSCLTSSANPDWNGCHPLCNTSADCDTGCCLPFSSQSGGFCTDAKYCTCVGEGTACGGIMDSNCCDGTTCASFGTAPSSCLTNCKVATDCPSGCCSSPFQGKDFGSCLAASACQPMP
jgi:hypothetical protein